MLTTAEVPAAELRGRIATHGLLTSKKARPAPARHENGSKKCAISNYLGQLADSQVRPIVKRQSRQLFQNFLL